MLLVEGRTEEASQDVAPPASSLMIMIARSWQSTEELAKGNTAICIQNMAYTHGESQESRRNSVDSRNKLSRIREREREIEATMHRRLTARGTRGCPCAPVRLPTIKVS